METTEMYFYIRLLRLCWTEHVRKNEVVREIQTKKDTDAYHQKETVEMSRAYNEESRPGDFYTSRTY